MAPGDYKVKTSKSYNFKTKNPPFLSSNTRFEERSNSEHKHPAPGTYENKTTLEEKLINKIQKGYMGYFGTTERRFKNMSLLEELPGPGAYLDVIHEKEGEDLQPSYIFKSNAERNIYK